MFSNDIAGSGIHDASPRFRMYAIVTVAIFALGSVLFWRTQLFVASDYVELPMHKVRPVKAALYDDTLNE